jgi:hypothetical protein
MSYLRQDSESFSGTDDTRNGLFSLVKQLG